MLGARVARAGAVEGVQVERRRAALHELLAGDPRHQARLRPVEAEVVGEELGEVGVARGELEPLCSARRRAVRRAASRRSGVVERRRAGRRQLHEAERWCPAGGVAIQSASSAGASEERPTRRRPAVNRRPGCGARRRAGSVAPRPADATRMEFRILGPLEVLAGGRAGRAGRGPGARAARAPAAPRERGAAGRRGSPTRSGASRRRRPRRGCSTCRSRACARRWPGRRRRAGHAGARLRPRPSTPEQLDAHRFEALLEEGGRELAAGRAARRRRGARARPRALARRAAGRPRLPAVRPGGGRAGSRSCGSPRASSSSRRSSSSAATPT